MNINYKLYLSIGLLFSMATPMLVYAEQLSNNAPSSSTRNENNDQSSVLTDEECDDLLHDIFENYFFNDNDKTRFCDIVTKMIEILQFKVKSLNPEAQIKCNNFIALLEKNKNIVDLRIWTPILVNSDLISLLPKKTQEFLNQVPNFKKLRTLVNKLKNN